MGEFTGVPFRQATNMNQNVSVERAENIPSTSQDATGFPNVPSFSDEKKQRRGRSRTRRDEPRDAFEKRKFSLITNFLELAKSPGSWCWKSKKTKLSFFLKKLDGVSLFSLLGLLDFLILLICRDCVQPIIVVFTFL